MKKISKKRFWEDFSTLEFSNLDIEKIVAVLPIAAIEQHGPHLPVGVDSIIIESLVNIISERLPKNSNLIFLPTQKIGKSNEHHRFPGTLSFTMETMTSMLVDIGNSLNNFGIRKLVLFNSHGGNISIMDTVVRELRIHNKMFVFNLNWFGLGMPDGIFTDQELKHGIHAGDLETSVMLAIDSDKVVLSKAKNFIPKTIELEKKFKNIGLNSGAKFGWATQDLNSSGACGNAEIATVEKGEKTLKFITNKLLDVFKEIESIPLSTISNITDY